MNAELPAAPTARSTYTEVAVWQEHEAALCGDGCGAAIEPGDRYMARLFPGEESQGAPIAKVICLNCARRSGWEDSR